MSYKSRKSEDATEKRSVTLPGKVGKIIPGVVSTMPDKAQIAVEGSGSSLQRDSRRKYSARREWQARVPKARCGSRGHNRSQKTCDGAQEILRSQIDSLTCAPRSEYVLAIFDSKKRKT